MNRPLRFLSAAALLLALLAGPALAAPPAARLQPEQSRISFTSKQMGVPVEGRFKRFDAQVMLDPQRPEDGRVVLEIDTGSAALSPMADAELPKAPWFDTAHFPRAVFRSSSIRAAGPGRLDVTGRLELKGMAREITVPVVLERGQGQETVASGSFMLRRLDFKVGDGEWTDTAMVADEVRVSFRLVLAGWPP
jgi:polyisoprenoid-binding protein YceI